MGTYPERVQCQDSKRCLYPQVHSGDASVYPQMQELTVGYTVPAVECDSILKTTEALTHAKICGLNLGDTRVSEIRQSQKDKCCTIPFYDVIRTVKFTETESRRVVVRAGGKKWGVAL